MIDEIDENSPVLVTGATGFLGHALVEGLLKRGVKIRVFVRSVNKIGDWEKRGVEIFRGDFSDLTRIEEATIGARMVYHLGETPITGSQSRRHNVEIVRRLIGRCAHQPRKRLVFASSLSVAGIPSESPATEKTPPKRQLDDPYTEYKRQSEELIRAAHIEDRLDYVIVRPSLVYGPGSRHLKRLLSWLEKYGKIGVPFVGRGNNIMPLIHLDDMTLLLVKVGDDPKAGAKIINAVDDGGISVRNFLIRLGQLMGKVVNIRALPKTLVRLAAIPVDALGNLIGFPFGIGGLVEMMSSDVVFSNVRMKARLDRPLRYPTATYGLPTLIDWYRREKELSTGGK